MAKISGLTVEDLVTKLSIITPSPSPAATARKDEGPDTPQQACSYQDGKQVSLETSSR